MRRTPYTEAGICRVPCARCQQPSSAQWQLRPCADKSLQRWVGLCGECDTELNRVVLEFFQVPNAGDLMQAYLAAA